MSTSESRCCTCEDRATPDIRLSCCSRPLRRRSAAEPRSRRRLRSSLLCPLAAWMAAAAMAAAPGSPVSMAPVTDTRESPLPCGEHQTSPRMSVRRGNRRWWSTGRHRDSIARAPRRHTRQWVRRRSRAGHRSTSGSRRCSFERRAIRDTRLSSRSRPRGTHSAPEPSNPSRPRTSLLRPHAAWQGSASQGSASMAAAPFRRARRYQDCGSFGPGTLPASTPTALPSTRAGEARRSVSPPRPSDSAHIISRKLRAPPSYQDN